ncbi:pseudouridine synthase [Leifsonia sp. Root227]|uniref:tRNA pseudouridine(38-40) synthase TruA n=1 Tax=unclassified Leifsonia TaxID=2663824 RepID=UPI0006FAA256|nr:tRNA pseudouridine(38-40) synthase TruA [Leifsonia sp. Root227]KRC49282.1 pseudouridine synthase [Leifsonia sp. Root227]
MNDLVTTRFRLDIAYQGTEFNGWARQPGQRTVQGELESALATIFRRYGDAPILTVAGRTDAGVHATGQVAHVDLTEPQVAVLRRRRGSLPVLPAAEVLARRVNGVLGPVPDVIVTAASIAPDGFDARFSAIWRRYEYRIADTASLRDPLQRHRTAWVSSALDVEAMDAAALGLLGLHDFASYCKPREGATTIRTLQNFGWGRDDDGVLVAEVKADAFCHSMVRSLVGACVGVGNGKLTPEELVALRDGQQRTNAFAVMPARGLTLQQVGYPDDVGLAIRAEQTRARRTL